MISIIPAILTDKKVELEEELIRCEPVVSRVQIDIIDGVFAKNITIVPENFFGIDTDLLLDFHLMVDNPIDWVERCAMAGADRIIAQIEKMSSQLEYVEKVQETGLGIGLAIDLETPVSEFDSVVLNNVDVVLVMAVKAGFGGQKLDKKVFGKIEELDEIRARDITPFKIIVDGGETLDNIDDTKIAGADEIVIGKRLFNGDLAGNIEKFKKAAYGR